MVIHAQTDAWVMIESCQHVLQIPGQPKGQAAWWGPKDDKALLVGYKQQGGLPWVNKAITSTVDAVLLDPSLDFTVKVSLRAVTMHALRYQTLQLFW